MNSYAESSSVEVKSEGTARVAILPTSPIASATPMPKPNYVRKSSFSYLFCVITLVLTIAYVGVWQFIEIGRAHLQELKPNLREPWIPFRWLGSSGVDVADLQWYFFIIALPPMAPILTSFILLSKKSKERSPLVVMPYSPAAAAAAAMAISKGCREEVPSPTRSPTGENTYEKRNPFAALHNSGERRRSSPSPLEPRGSPTQQSNPSSYRRYNEGQKGSGEICAVAVGMPSDVHASTGSLYDPCGTHRYLYFGKDLTLTYLLHILFGVAIAALITGPGFLFGVALMLLNYFVITPLQRCSSFRVAMTVMWVVHIAILFLNFHADGYRFAWFGLSFLDNAYFPLVRWSVHYNMSLLRMIAFNNDYWEACMHGDERREKAVSKHLRCCAHCAVIRDANRHISPTGGQAESLRCYRCRTEYPRPLEEYCLLSYLAYMFYPPLLIAGPMISFNAYVSHLHYPTAAVVGKALWRYGVRFLMNAVGLSVMMHYVWVTAILYTKPSDVQTTTMRPWGAGAASDPTTTVSMTVSSALPTQKTLSVFEQLDYVGRSKLFYLFLAFTWFKFNVFWKFFRLFALLDGVDPPEDMRRCFSNTTSIQGFWRDWHASFNLWIVRYMYIPMGGRQRVKLSIFPIFFFIAIWHDIEMRLLFWALFMCIFMIPEVTVTTLFSSKKNPFVVRVKRNVSLYRLLRVVATCVNMLFLIVVNLIGFSIGMSGAGSEMNNVLGKMSARFMAAAVFLFLCAANIAVQSRDQEAYESQVLAIKYNLQVK